MISFKFVYFQVPYKAVILVRKRSLEDLKLVVLKMYEYTSKRTRNVVTSHVLSKAKIFILKGKNQYKTNGELYFLLLLLNTS